MKKLVIILLLTIFCAIQAQSISTIVHPDNVNEAIEKAGMNRRELSKAFAHFVYTGDSLGLKCAYYLVGNMDGHSYVTYVWKDTSDQEVQIDVLAYPNYDSLMVIVDAIEREHGELDYIKNNKFMDLEEIESDFLVDNINWALQAWREKPWAKHLTFEQFCEYVLPYRGSNEPLEAWREIFWERYADINKDMKNQDDPIEAAALINDDLKSWFKFDPRYYLHPTDQGVQEMFNSKMGRCEDMTNLTIFALRANGIAVTSDYTPYWADAGNNHAWNAILTKDGNVMPFMGAEANPGSYKLHNRMAKVYRKTFSIQDDNLYFQKYEDEKIPRWLSGKNYKDVTADYTLVSDFTLQLDVVPDEFISHAYISVFNSGDWRIIDWGNFEKQQVTFKKIGRNIAYLPAYYIGEKIVLAGSPFILQKDGTVKTLTANENNLIDIKLTSTSYRSLDKSTDTIKKSFLKAGVEYEFFYWQDGWQSAGIKKASDQPLLFNDIPEGTLYWLQKVDSNHEERIFTYQDHQQIWW